MKQLLVTTGATVTFEKLIRTALSIEYIGQLIDLQYSKLVVQYGRSAEAKVLVDSLLAKLSEKYGADCGGLAIECIPFDSDLAGKYTSKSDLVISHAGTGSIMDTLRLGKKLIVMINDSLQDNHQLEIAKAFEQLGVLKVCYGEDSLVEQTKEIETVTLEKLPEPHGFAVEEVVLEEVA